jgi:cytoskeletal protein CcmA (bactofilin family)
MSDHTQKPDLKINGSGTASGGAYNLVRINGAGRITGDLECCDLVINGSGDVNGNAQCETVKVNGSGRIGGDVKSKEVKVSGTANFGSGIACETFKILGSADVKADVEADTLDINGSMKAGGNCSAEEFSSSGMFEIGGLLNSESIDIRLYWHKSRAKEIGGEKIKVALGKSGLGVIKAIFPGINFPQLEAELIEGDDITLENTAAKVVRGNNVVIGGGCDIGLVEYKGSFRKNTGAKVAEEKKI